MEMLETSLVKWLFQIIITMVFVGLMFWIIKSAQNSLKATGGKWSSVLDEVVIGIVVIVIYLLIVASGQAAVVTKIQAIWAFLWGELLAPFLREILQLPV